MSNDARAKFAGVRVLLVDDDPDTLELFAYVLRAAGAAVSAVTSPGQALELFNHGTFDVLVSDAGLPHMDGWSLIETIRGMRPERGGRIAAIAVTARAYPEDIAHSLASGFDVHLSKPIECEDLVAAIASLVGGRRSASGSTAT